MPQTREHMEICNLMGIRHGMIALTKTDLVDEDLLELAQNAQDVGADLLMHATPYSNASSNDGVYRYYKYIADRVDIGICLYNTKPTGYILSPEFINELADVITSYSIHYTKLYE